MLPFEVPPGLAAQSRLGPEWEAWLGSLPRTTADLLDEWSLSVDGDPMHGFCSLVVPVRTASGGPAVL